MMTKLMNEKFMKCLEKKGEREQRKRKRKRGSELKWTQGLKQS